MYEIKKHIPNALTCGNLICGIFGILYVFKGELITASVLIGIALICDWLDGFIARLLHVSSPIGKELDSLADMVTFGVLPAFMMLKLIVYMLQYISMCKNSCNSGLRLVLGLPVPDFVCASEVFMSFAFDLTELNTVNLAI